LQFLWRAAGGDSTIDPAARSAVFGVSGRLWYRPLVYVIDTILLQIVLLILAFSLGFSMAFSMAVTGSGSADEAEFVGAALGFISGFLLQWLWFTFAESSSW